MSTVEELLNQILQNQRKFAEGLSQQRELICNIERRLDKIEVKSPEAKQSNVPTSLIRVLKGLANEEKPVNSVEAAKAVKLSRNLTSGYLNRLADLGYVTKDRNLEGKGSRYLFKVNYSGIPQHIRKILKQYES